MAPTGATLMVFRMYSLVNLSINRCPYPCVDKQRKTTASQARHHGHDPSHRLNHVDDASNSASCRPACAKFIASRASCRSCDRCSGAGVFDGEEVPKEGFASRRPADWTIVRGWLSQIYSGARGE